MERERINAIRNEILSYQPGTAVPCKDERVVFPSKLFIDIGKEVDYMSAIHVPVHAMRSLLYGEEEAEKLMSADIARQTPTENQQEFWITDYISLMLIKTSRPDTAEGKEGAIRDLAEKVGCMVKIVNTLKIEDTVKEIKQIKEITGRFPVCAILYNALVKYMDEAKYALKQSGITDYCEVPYSDVDTCKWQWLHLLHKCLSEGDTVLAANDQKKICTNPRCESFYENIKKKLEEANREKTSLLQFLASPEGTNKVLDKDLEKALGNWKQRTQLQQENEIRSAEQQKKADTPLQM